MTMQSLHIGLFSLATFKVTFRMRVPANINFWQLMSGYPHPHWQTHAYRSLCLRALSSQRPTTDKSFTSHSNILPVSASKERQSAPFGASLAVLSSFVLWRLEKLKQLNGEWRWCRIPNGKGAMEWQNPVYYVVCALFLPRLGVWCSDENYIGIQSNAFCMHCIMQQMRFGASVRQNCKTCRYEKEQDRRAQKNWRRLSIQFI